ncbi:hypothetical protein [Sporolactobacillus terrae]|uniref:Uncharacterized protein n=1 Tax=Sporolactobacillus terrae TaxID=269673 RepID=A0A5K7WZT4_9BACL|nr:hypothetical protein [Sporolactobacillus terrae]BBN97843.1 hypothetical protein St703_05480 [Sporolactobacillus terrae]
MKLRNVQINALLIFLILCCTSGILGLLSHLFDFQLLRLWKEVYIALLLIMTLALQIHRQDNNLKSLLTMRMLIGVTIFFCFEIIYSMYLSLPIKVIIYQLKIDFFVIVFAIICWDIMIQNSKVGIINLFKKNVYILLTLGFINALAIAFERFFPHTFTNLIGLTWGNWGSNTGVKVIVSGGHIRSIGLLSTFVASGTFMLICLILLVETRKIFQMNYYFHLLLMTLFSVSIIMTTYKTAIIGLVFYSLVKVIPSISKKYRAKIISISAVATFAVFLISTHFYGINNLVSKINEKMAYNSIFLRIEFHREIINQLHSVPEVLFGLGMGKNGVFGLDKSVYHIKSLPTDSTYIYLVSNYGYIGAALVILIIALVTIYLFKNEIYDIVGARYILIYTMCIEFFYNNFFADFPTNIIVILLAVLSTVSSIKNINYNTVGH